MRTVALLVAVPLLVPSGFVLAQGAPPSAAPAPMAAPSAAAPAPAAPGPTAAPATPPSAQATPAPPPTAAAPAPAARNGGGFACADIPKAQDFIDRLRPGPNTRAAQRHLDAAKQATSDRQCIAELRQVDKYARRSAAADKRLAARQAAGRPMRAPMRAVPCADPLHQNRPGGTDYRGPPVPGCPTPRI